MKLVKKSVVLPSVVAQRVIAPKKVVIRVGESADDELLKEIEDEEHVGFRTEFYSEKHTARRVAPVLEVSGLDPDKIYGVEFMKLGTFNVRQIRPASGLELKRRWVELMDYEFVHYFANGIIRKGFRVLQLPNGVCVGICDWQGPKYTPDVDRIQKPKRLKFRPAFKPMKLRLRK